MLYRRQKNQLEVLLAHPGGPFWKNKDEGAWTIPKGEISEGEDRLAAAIRETKEELGVKLSGDFIALTPVKQKSGKVIFAWALEQDIDPGMIASNSFEIEWPPKSGLMKSFPEIDRAEWFEMEEALQKINPGQSPLLIELSKMFFS